MSEYSAPPAPATGYAPQAPLNALGIVAFVLSLCGFNVIAVVLGHISLSQIKRTGERGSGFAIAALVIGYLTLLGILLLIVIAVVIPLVFLGMGSGSGY